MKNWGKCLHESQTIWDMCVCVCVCVHVDDGRRGAKGSKVLPCLTQVQWSLPIPKSSMPLDTKKQNKSLSIDEITKKAFYPIRPHLLFP